MPLVYHKFHQSSVHLTTGASVELILEEGLLSQKQLREIGKLPPSENVYEIAVRNYEVMKTEYETKYSDNPALLDSIIDSLYKGLFNGHTSFYEPGVKANCEENIFFGHHQHPTSDSDWVAIEVPESTLLHCCTHRDLDEFYRWSATAITIKDFDQLLEKNLTPPGWENTKYNEYLVPRELPPERIVAYAKVEKEFRHIDFEITPAEIEYIQSFINEKFKFATQFSDFHDNVLISIQGDNFIIRISFNKDKISGYESEVSEFFDQFGSLQQLTISAIFENPEIPEMAIAGAEAIFIPE